jgi:hypothetical protein
MNNTLEEKNKISLDCMVKAYGILCELGDVEFNKFCKETEMPPGDIEAVIRKHSGKYDVTKLAQGIG